jgi:mono/diheme cytochrome c family protein
VKKTEKEFRRSLLFVPAVALVGVAVFSTGRQTQAVSQSQSKPLIRSIEGPDLFQAYCAACHGADGRGGGPAAPALKTKPPDLTLLTRKNRGQFPVASIRETILGEQVVVAHGSREMPIWGPTFHQVEGDMDWGNVRLENLVKYLESIQSTSAPKAPSGAAPHP